MTDHSAQPTDDERRRAVCQVMGRGPVLVRYARRYVQCLDDAEDAYQRAMEIALTKAPVTEPARLLAWLYTVVRNEALAVARERSRQGLGRADDAARLADGEVGVPSPESGAEWRERYRAIQDALGSLSEQQRTCVMLKSAGMTYDQIAEATGLSHRQIERAISRGRSRLHAWEDKLQNGAACDELRPALERVASREATDRELRRVARHVRVCSGCRTSMRHRLTTTEALAGLVPLAVLSSVDPLAPLPDPGHLVAAWERAAAAVLARTGQLLTAVVEWPASGVARVGGAVAAILVAGLALLPIASDEASPKAPQRAAAGPASISIDTASPARRVLEAARAAVSAAPAAPAPKSAAPAPKKVRPTRPRTGPPARIEHARVAAAPAPMAAPMPVRPAAPTRAPRGAPSTEFAP